MRSEAIEAAVAAFLERREADPTLTPARFVAEYVRSTSEESKSFPDGEEVTTGPHDEAELLRAIHAAIEVDRLLPGASPMPRSIGPYRVVREIGRGGMGIVYEVQRQDAVAPNRVTPVADGTDADREDGQRLALKLHPVSPLWSARAAERLRREIGALAGVSHDNIVRVRDWGEHEGAPYIVMDLVDGVRLDEAGSGLARDEAVRIVGILARAVHEAHACGVIHRDLKPQNVILREDGSPVLVDFGLSLSEDLPSLTLTGELIGTPRYMAPEQVHDGTADVRTDVYALGLILYELLTRRPARASRSREGLLREASVGELQEPRRIDATIPAALERIVLQALAFAPEDRYENAAALADDLDRYGRGERVLARPPRSMASRSQKAHWGRRLALGAIAVTVLAGSWQIMQMRSAAQEERRAEAASHVVRALGHHLDGDSAAAIAELDRAASLDPSGTSTIAMRAHILREDVPADASPDARELREALRDFSQGNYGGARRRLAETEVEPSLRAILAGLSADGNGDAEAAERELLNASQLQPTNTFILQRLADVYRKQGILPRAHATLVRATEIDSSSARLWVQRAATELARRDMEGGLRSVEIARSFGDSTNAKLLLIEAELCSNSARGSRARELARQVLARDPAHGEAWYQLGFAHDIDHQSKEARDAYLQATISSPEDPRPWFCLANLYSGASRGECGQCDAVYAAHPELLDFDRAEAALLRTLELDRGRQEWIMRSTLDIAMRLERRDRVIALVDQLVDADPSSSPGLRLAELARRLRLTSR